MDSFGIFLEQFAVYGKIEQKVQTVPFKPPPPDPAGSPTHPFFRVTRVLQLVSYYS